MKKIISQIPVILIIAMIFCLEIYTQTTEFTYQGTLNDNSTPANGNYDFEFALFNSLSGGSQIGSTIMRANVAVTDGVFTVKIDFGGQFPGADRFLEIRVKQSVPPSVKGENLGGFTTLSPRQAITSSPYTVKSLNAENALNFSGSLSGDVTGPQSATKVEKIQGTAVSMTPPANNQVLRFDSSSNQWVPATGGIIGITTGTGLSLSGSSGSVVLSVANSGIGTTQLAPNAVTDAKIVSISGTKVTGTVTNSAQLGGVPAGNYLVGNSGDFIRNQLVQQTSSNFNISGTGKASIFDVYDQYNQNGNRVLESNFNNLFVGFLAGENNTGKTNWSTFVGPGAGRQNTTGSFNTFVGTEAGRKNTTASSNTFVGRNSGKENTTGNGNSFFGTNAGEKNVTGSGNAFFGNLAGFDNLAGYNSFFGSEAGISTTTGVRNTFVGRAAGSSNVTGNDNTILGYNAQLISGDLNNATAIGALARVDISNAIVLGSINGINGATANTRVGIGTSTPERTVHVRGPGSQEIMVESSDTSGRKWTVQASGNGGNGRFEIVDRTAVASRLAILDNGRVGIGSTSPDNRLQVNGAIQVTGARSSVTGNAVTISSESSYDLIQSWNNRPLIFNSLGNSVGIGVTNPQDKLDVDGRIRVSQLGSAGSTQLCRNASNQMSTCSSSIRYKSNITGFSNGLEIVKRLRPVSFKWKDGGMLDFGLVAEEVADIEPLLTTTNKAGRIEGVKYDRIGVVLVNAVKEQQTLMDEMEQKIHRQQKELDVQKDIIKKLQIETEVLKKQNTVLQALTSLICSNNPEAKICQKIKDQ